MVPLTLGSIHAGWWQHFGKAGFSHVPQKGIDFKKGCDLPEVRANTYSSKDPRSHFCALTVQQTHQGLFGCSASSECFWCVHLKASFAPRWHQHCTETDQLEQLGSA